MQSTCVSVDAIHLCPPSVHSSLSRHPVHKRFEDILGNSPYQNAFCVLYIQSHTRKSVPWCRHRCWHICCGFRNIRDRPAIARRSKRLGTIPIYPLLEVRTRMKNTKNWYTIDALGAIIAIFTRLDTFTKLLQYYYNTITILLQYYYNTFTILLQY